MNSIINAALPLAQQVDVVHDVVFASPGGRHLLADIYLPNTTGLRPAILWLHGGGWRFGDRRLAPDLVQYYAKRGYVMVSIDYRLSKHATFPAALEDVKTAIRWLKSEASQYQIDRHRIGLWGASAGGHLAALATTTDPLLFAGADYLDQDCKVAAVVDLYGPTDFLQMDAHRDPEGKPSDDVESIQLPPGKLSADADSLESMFIGASIQSRPDLVSAANPLSYIKPGLPPFLILHGTSDTAVPMHQSQLLYDALAKSGSEVTFGAIKGLGHGFSNRKNLDETEWPIELCSSGSGASPMKQVSRRIFEFIGDWFDEHLQ